MLYISRYISSGTYGVVDTDDDVETVVSQDELRDAVLSYGLNIKGVVLGNSAFGRRISFVSVYQDPRYCTALQAKTKTMLGVDVRVFRSEVVYIEVSGRIVLPDIRIRLSAYAPKLNGYTPVMRPRCMPDMIVTLVLDDNIELVGDIFKIGAGGVRIDVSEVTNEIVIDAVYRHYAVRTDMSVSKLKDFIVDTSGRGAYWWYVCLLNSPINEAAESWKELKGYSGLDAATKRLESMYWWEFAALANKDFEAEFFSELVPEDFSAFVTGFLDGNVDVQRGCQSYEQARSWFPYIGQFLRIASSVNLHMVLRFENFVKFFKVSDDTKELCVNMCNKVCSSIVNYCNKNGLQVPG